MIEEFLILKYKSIYIFEKTCSSQSSIHHILIIEKLPKNKNEKINTLKQSEDKKRNYILKGQQKNWLISYENYVSQKTMGWCVQFLKITLVM